MADYIILSPKTGPDKDPDAVFVRDGFSLLAALFPVFWLLWHRMWLWAVGLFGIFAIAGEFATTPMLEIILGLMALGVSLFFGFEGQHMLVRTLAARGATVRAVVTAPDLETAERLYFLDAPMVFASRPNSRPAISTPAKGGQGVGVFDSYGGI